MRKGWLEFKGKAYNTNIMTDVAMSGSGLTIYFQGVAPKMIPFQDAADMAKVFKTIADLPGWVEIRDSGLMRTLNTNLMCDVELSNRVIMIHFANSPMKTMQAPNGETKVLDAVYKEILHEIKQIHPEPVKPAPVKPVVIPETTKETKSTVTPPEPVKAPVSKKGRVGK